MASNPSSTDSAEHQSFIARHKPSAVVLASQISAAVVHGLVKTLESGTNAVNPFQVLLICMLVTGLGCLLYLRRKPLPEFPLGPPEVRLMLILRAVGGVLGAGGLYYSIMYLTLSQATALNFLAPMGAIMLSKYMNHGSFNVIDPAGAAIALAGVVMVIQPEGIFQMGKTTQMGPKTDPCTKLKGLACGLVGVLGTLIALTKMRYIGSRAHPLIIVHYLAWVVFLVATALVFIKRLAWPTSWAIWGYMMVVGISGGLAEVLLTAGIASDQSSVATLMIYSQVIWALALDRIFWNVQMNVWTFVGVGSVVGSLVLVSIAKEMPRCHSRRKLYKAVPTERNNGMTIVEIDPYSISDAEQGFEL